MTEYGGWPNVLSMKKVQEMSRNDTRQGPYDIVYTGGEALQCNHNCAVHMMPNEQMKQLALKEKINDCAYLFPKEELLPISVEGGKKMQNVAIINSLGGLKVKGSCKKAVDTADFAVYRDHDPLCPDSAVMTKELFQEDIREAARYVLKDLFKMNVKGKYLHRRANKNYIAVQCKKSILRSTDQKSFANMLDDVSRKTNATIVFFAAGTAPDHDSFSAYDEVARHMKEPSIVYKVENTW
eukprot:CAMPEP_0194332584 /NCGR_PEP_ID=MMETSP0171-20130528/59606_1 /TAXON_ID=218684 /ORGANISM="Corethron pennatum, Strain L29A3" /LENGTH=238 /DNA_ID=CAMNT_0039094495 /DNA_START=295 /DNA_END=1008 /DNA_ORIENTATION=-